MYIDTLTTVLPLKSRSRKSEIAYERKYAVLHRQILRTYNTHTRRYSNSKLPPQAAPNAAAMFFQTRNFLLA